MSFYLDSSVLVAAITDIEPHHDPCAALLLGRTPLIVRPHALVETFSALTGGRLALRLSAAMAARLIEINILPRVSLSDLTAAEVMKTLRDCEKLGVRGGAIHDYMHLATARKAKAASLRTLDVRNFRAFHRPGDPEIVRP